MIFVSATPGSQLKRRDHAEVRALHMSWFVRLVNRRMSEKRPEVRILAVESSVMSKHCRYRAERNEVSFVMNVTGIFRDDAMLRQIMGSALIDYKVDKADKIKEHKLINSESEWNYVRIPRAVVTL